MKAVISALSPSYCRISLTPTDNENKKDLQKVHRFLSGWEKKVIQSGVVSQGTKQATKHNVLEITIMIV